jgi:phosphoadenosine phosphosulfate reductase
LVECDLAKVDVAGSNPVSRSKNNLLSPPGIGTSSLRIPVKGIKRVTSTDSASRMIAAALAEFQGSLAVLTSFQREGVVVIDLVLKAAPRTPVLTIDTGRLPEATLQMIWKIEARYGIAVERIHPDPNEVAAMTESLGTDLFRDGVAQRMLCCNVRKVRPLARRMSGVAAYFTGLRREQSESRAAVEFFDRSGTTVLQPVKISPLADWTAADVAQYTLDHDLPEHPLYAAGYTSIGCDPCTRAVIAGEDERAGRWWWETDTDKECGLHFSPDGRVERKVDVLLRELLGKVHTG